MDKNIQLYCNTDYTGKITRILTGERIIPTTSFQYFFMIDKKTEINLDKYYIVNSELKQIDGTTLIEVENLNPSTEQQLEDVKKQLAAMQQLIDSLTNPKSPTEEPTTETPAEEPSTEEPTTETPAENSSAETNPL
ncbi:hypothetical protein [Priestia aryabhattai]|uniref:hypothetical protein n=1 Tax=Priestia aryabhattai TaxID=412384 RepID=UPI003CA6C04D